MTQNISISKIKPNTGQIDGLPANPRFIRDEKFEALKLSLREDPEMLELRELIVFPLEEEYIIIGGNMRYRCALDLEFKELPCKILNPETSVKKLRAITIKDNVSFGQWDMDILANEWDTTELELWGMDSVAEFNADTSEEDEKYTKKIEAPVYEPKKAIQPSEDLLCNSTKCNDLITEIRNAKIPKKVKDFLTLSAYRHIVFDYEEIAEYYAHASKDVQCLMEKSALVIIDFDKAIENGYTQIKQDVYELMSEDLDDEE